MYARNYTPERTHLHIDTAPGRTKPPKSEEDYWLEAGALEHATRGSKSAATSGVEAATATESVGVFTNTSVTVVKQENLDAFCSSYTRAMEAVAKSADSLVSATVASFPCSGQEGHISVVNRTTWTTQPQAALMAELGRNPIAQAYLTDMASMMVGRATTHTETVHATIVGKAAAR